MAKAVAICMCSTCGKEFKKEKKCFNRRDADSWEAWATEHFDTCSDCWKKEQEEKAKAATEDLAPITEGSSKQIAWAIRLRAEAQSEFNKIAQFVKEDKKEEWYAACTVILNSHIDARFWIDNTDSLRYATPGFLARSDFWRKEFAEAGCPLSE